nr:13603_t:CDS:2 [Entrophospora candida]
MERKPHFDNFSDDELISWKVEDATDSVEEVFGTLPAKKLSYNNLLIWKKIHFTFRGWEVALTPNISHFFLFPETTIDEKWKKAITILNKDDELKLWRLVMKLPPVGFILNLHEGQSQLASVPRTTHSFTAPNDSFGSALKQVISDEPNFLFFFLQHQVQWEAVKSFWRNVKLEEIQFGFDQSLAGNDAQVIMNQKRLDRLLKKKREDSCSVTDDVTDKNNIDACSVTNDVADKDDTDALPTKKNRTDGVGFVTNADKFQFVYVEGNYQLNEVDSTNLHGNFHRCKDLYIFMKYIEVGAVGSDVTISFDEARTK